MGYRIRTFVESLECRRLLTVVFHSPFGGDSILWLPGNGAGQPANQIVNSPISNNPTVLRDPHVYIIFWGNTWTSSLAQQFSNDASTIINSGYLSLLTDYGSDGKAIYGGYTIDNSTATPGPVTATQEIQRVLPGLPWLKPLVPASPAGSAFWPGAASAPIYVVVSDHGNGGGNGPDDYTPPNTSTPLAMNHIWIGTGGYSSIEEGFTLLFSHELVERISAGGGGIAMNASVNIAGEFQSAQIADNEAETYTYQLNGSILVQAYWSLSYHNFVIPDGNSAVVYLQPNWDTQNKIFNGDSQLSVTANQITIDGSQNDGVLLSVRSQSFKFNQYDIDLIYADSSGSGATINVLQSIVPIYTYSNAPANINVGDGSPSRIINPVTIQSLQDLVSLTVDDSADTSARSVTISATKVHGLSFGDINFQQGTLASLKVFGGVGGDTFFVNDTPSAPVLIGPTTTLYTDNVADTIDVLRTSGDLVIDGGAAQSATPASDTINIGSQARSIGGTLLNLHGSVTVTNVSKAHLLLNDFSDSNTETSTISGSSVTGLGGAPVNFTGMQLASLTVITGNGSNTVNVTGIAAPTTLFGRGNSTTVNVRATSSPFTFNGGGGGGSVNIGSQAPNLGGTLAAIQQPITVTNTSNGTPLSVDDSADTSTEKGTIGANSISGFGAKGSINYIGSQLSSLTIHSGSGDNTVTVNGTSTFTTLVGGSNATTVNIRATTKSFTYDGGGSGGAINIGSNAPSLGGSLTSIQGPITITHVSSLTLSLDDSGDIVKRSGNITATTITGFGMGAGASVSYTGGQLQGVVVNTGTGGATATVSSTSTNTSITGKAPGVNTLFVPTADTTFNMTGTYAGSVANLNLTFSDFLVADNAIDAGGPAAGSYVSDVNFNGGSVTDFGNIAIDTSAVTNPAPLHVYQTQRSGNFSYVIAGLTAGAKYTIRLDFVEEVFNAKGKRLFNVTINSNTVLSSFDVFAAAGKKNKALSRSFTATANSSGLITINFVGVKGNAIVNGISATKI